MTFRIFGYEEGLKEKSSKQQRKVAIATSYLKTFSKDQNPASKVNSKTKTAIPATRYVYAGGKESHVKEMALMDLTGLHEESLKALEAPFNDAKYRPVNVQAPTFFGHYWLTPEQMTPLASFVACLDSSCVFSKQLTAYRYNAGDENISRERFVSFTA